MTNCSSLDSGTSLIFLVSRFPAHSMTTFILNVLQKEPSHVLLVLVGVVPGPLHPRRAAAQRRRQPEGVGAVRHQVAGYAVQVSLYSIC